MNYPKTIVTANPVPGASCDLKTRVLTKVEELESIRDELEELARQATEPNVYFEPWMLLPALSYLGRDIKLECLCFYTSGKNRRLCGFLPLYQKSLHSRVPVRIHKLWQNKHYYSGTPLVRADYSDSFWDAVLTWLSTSRLSSGVLDLQGLNADDDVGHALQHALERSKSISYFVQYEQTYFLRTMEDADTALRLAMSRKTLAKKRQQQRRLAELGDLTFGEVNERSNVNRFIDEFLELEARGWKGADGGAIALDPQAEKFFRQVILEAFDRKQLSFTSLRLDGRMIAARILLLAHPGSFAFKVAYDETMKKYSPGMLLEMKAIQWAHDTNDVRRQGVQWCASGALTTARNSGPTASFFPHRRRVGRYFITAGSSKACLLAILQVYLRKRCHKAEYGFRIKCGPLEFRKSPADLEGERDRLSK